MPDFQKRNIIYIYNDDGVSRESLKHTIAAFNQFNKYELKTINAELLKEGAWLKDVNLLVMPGGADLPYAEKLTGRGNDIIKQYVEEGGKFLGICAGGYYGSSYVEFDKNGPYEVLASRELAFFKGKSIGPIFAPYHHRLMKGARAIKIKTILQAVKECTIFYYAGSYFEDAEKYPETKIIARYENDLPAIIFVDCSKGKVLLSGVHFEYEPALLNAADKYLKMIIEPLKQGNQARKVLFSELLKLLDL